MDMPASAPLDGFIFDMDGVIVDTEMIDHRIQCEFVRAVNAAHGEPSDEAGFASLVGASYAALDRRLRELTHCVWSEGETHRRFVEFDKAQRAGLDYAALFRTETVNVLDTLRLRGVATAVCSSSALAHIEEVLSACGVLDRFDVVYSGENVPQSKPHPQIYLNTLAELSRASGEEIRPERCMALEDSTYGIAAAKAAGIGLVVAYEETRVAIDQSQADAMVHDMTDMQRMLERYLGSFHEGE